MSLLKEKHLSMAAACAKSMYGQLLGRDSSQIAHAIEHAGCWHMNRSSKACFCRKAHFHALAQRSGSNTLMKDGQSAFTAFHPGKIVPSGAPAQRAIQHGCEATRPFYCRIGPCRPCTVPYGTLKVGTSHNTYKLQGFLTPFLSQ